VKLEFSGIGKGICGHCTIPLGNVEANVNDPVELAVNTGCCAAQLNGSVNVTATFSPPVGACGTNVICANAG